MDYTRSLVIGVIAAVVVAAMAALGTSAPPDKAGWRHLRPSAMHWTGITLGTALVVLMGYIRLFVGSTRADAENQMAILTWLIAAFALGTIAVALSMAATRRRAVRWRGGRIAWRQGGHDERAELDEVTVVTANWLGERILTFADGRCLALDPYAQGAQELIESAEERASVR